MANEYKIKLSAIIDPTNLAAQIEKLSGKYSIKIGMDVDAQGLAALKTKIADIQKSIGNVGGGTGKGLDLIDSKELQLDGATIDSLKQKIADLGIAADQVSKVDVFKRISKDGEESVRAVVNYKNGLGEATQETLKLEKATEGLSESWVKVGEKTTVNIGAVEKMLEQATTKVNKFNERVKDLGDTQDVLAAKAKAKELGAAVSEGDIQKVQKLSKEFDVLSARVNQAGVTSYSFAKQIGVAIQRTIEWAAAMGLVYGAFNQLKKGIGFLVELNKEMTNIQIVSGATDAEVARLALDYNKLAKEMGGTTVEIAKGSLEWIRQGKTAAETQELLRSTMMMAKLGNMETAEATEYLTSIINGFKLKASETEDVVSALVAADNMAATSVAELASAMQRSAVSAQLAGVSLEELVAMVGTVSSVSRRSGETVGTAFRTMFARFQDIKSGRLDEDGMGINNVADALARVNINIRNADGGFRDFYDVIEDLYPVWENLGTIEQSNIAKAMAGVRQRESLITLLENQTMVEGLLEGQYNSSGLAAERYGIYLEGVEAAQNKMKASSEALWLDFLSSDTIARVYDFLTAILDLIDGFGGLEVVLPVVTTLLLAFNRQMLISGIASLETSIKAATGAITGFGMATKGAMTASMVAQYGAFATTLGVVAIAAAAVVAVWVQWNKQITETQKAGLEATGTAWQQSMKKSGDVAKDTGDVIKDLELKVKSLDKTLSELKGWEKFARLFVDDQKILKQGFVETEKALRTTAKTYDEYVIAVQRAAKITGVAIDEYGNVLERTHTGALRVTEQNVLLTESLYNLANATMKVAEPGSAIDGWEHYKDTVEEVEGAVYSLISSLSALGSESDMLGELISKSQEEGLDPEDVKKLSEAYENYLDFLTIEGDQIEINVDKIREYNIAKAQQALETAKAAGATEEELAVLSAYVREVEKAIPQSREFANNFQRFIELTSENLEGESLAMFQALGDELTILSQQFEDGALSASEYFDTLETRLADVNLSSMFGEDREAAQTFFSGLTMNAAQSLSQINSMFEAGESSLADYTSQMSQLGDVFTVIGEMALSYSETLGITGEAAAEMQSQVTGALGSIGSATEELKNMQLLNYEVQQAMVAQTVENLQYGSQAYSDYMMRIALAAEQSGYIFTDMQGNVFEGANAIYGYLTSAAGNFSIFADSTASKTGQTIQKLVNSAGSILKALGDAIANFNATINFTPVRGPTALSIPLPFTDKTFDIPSFSLNISSSGGDSLSALGGAISSFGQGLMDYQNDFDSGIYINPGSFDDFQGGIDGAGDAVYGIGGALNDLNDAFDAAGGGGANAADKIKKAMQKAFDAIKKAANAEKDRLKELLKSYKRIIDAQKRLLKQQKESDEYADKIADKEKEISDIKARLIELGLDDSAEAQAEKLRLEEELAKAEKELAKEQSDWAYDQQVDALDEEYRKYEEQIEAKIKLVDEYLEKQQEKYDKAMDNLENRTASAYGSMNAMASNYANNVASQIGGAWNTATNAMLGYQNAVSLYQDAIMGPGVSPLPFQYIYHDGGIAGGETTPSGEIFAKLMAGEIVVTPDQISNLFATMGGTPATESQGMGYEIKDVMNITVMGNMDDSVLPKLESLAGKIAGELAKTMQQRGHTRRADAFSI